MRHGASNFKNVLSFFYGSPWAIHPAKLAELRAVVNRRVFGTSGASPENVQVEHSESWRLSAFPSSSLPKAEVKAESAPTEALETGEGYSLAGNVAVISINGCISPRPSLFDEFSGGTSHESIGRATNAALANGKVESIVYDVDSPGGTVYGMPETADIVRKAGKQKPTTAVANHVGASAAYWYMAQAGTVAVTPSGQVGCIGVLMNVVDETEALKTEGIKDVLISNKESPFKSERWPQTVLTEEARAAMQAEADKYGTMFLEAVALGRNKRPATVARDFGKGRMLTAGDALEAGMVDEINTLQVVVDRMSGAKSGAAKRKIAAALAKYGMPTS